MEYYTSLVNVSVSFINTEKERFDKNVINDIMEYLEFNEYEIFSNEIIEDGFAPVADKFKEYKIYQLEIRSAISDFDAKMAKEVASVINNFEDTNHSISVKDCKLLKEI